MPEDELVAVCCDKPAIHRFPAVMARRIHALCAAVAADHRGKAERIWRDVDSGTELDANTKRSRVRSEPLAQRAPAAGDVPDCRDGSGGAHQALLDELSGEAAGVVIERRNAHEVGDGPRILLSDLVGRPVLEGTIGGSAPPPDLGE